MRALIRYTAKDAGWHVWSLRHSSSARRIVAVDQTRVAEVVQNSDASLVSSLAYVLLRHYRRGIRLTRVPQGSDSRLVLAGSIEDLPSNYGPIMDIAAVFMYNRPLRSVFGVRLAPTAQLTAGNSNSELAELGDYLTAKYTGAALSLTPGG